MTAWCAFWEQPWPLGGQWWVLDVHRGPREEVEKSPSKKIMCKTILGRSGGCLYWMAPELIDPDRFGRKFIRTPATDVYAFGLFVSRLTTLQLYTGRPPFSEMSETAALFRIIGGERAQRPVRERSISDGLWREITRYWDGDPASRPTIEVVLQNPVWPKHAMALEREDHKTLAKPFIDKGIPPPPWNASGKSQRTPKERATLKQSCPNPDLPCLGRCTMICRLKRAYRTLQECNMHPLE
ncbi:hypothetical protein FB45DRAFT_871508 [Roridomyces roridus]|uniref:Protein kinase domain-containing protein n=1 Tax=Roridomyces roridus TaxID=1738132 RepID=A0AAD7FEF7_9AGAR|nr:hypothetical protein FB45DRAFT_871508 [Roridomyces roridus]